MKTFLIALLSLFVYAGGPTEVFAEGPAVSLLATSAMQGTWDKNEGGINFRYDGEQARAGAGACLQLTYGVAAEKQEAGFWLGLIGRDLSKYWAVAFWVKGAKGGEVFRVGLKDGSSFEDKLDVTTYLPDGITTEWQKVTIPLMEFKTIKNWYSMDSFSVTFRNEYGKPYTGIIYMDGLAFEGERTGVERQPALRWESPALETLSDEQFLDLVENSAAMFFWNEANPENGIIRDSCNSIYEDAFPMGSIASVGFGLPVLCVAEKRGWLPRRDVYDRVLTTLKFFRDEAENVHGFYYHFLDTGTGQRWGGCELSSIDTTLLMAGVVFAGEYFKGTEIETIAKQLYDRIDWQWMMDGGATPSMGWLPEKGFLPYRWNSYSEHMVLYFLGIGSDTSPMPVGSWDAFARPVTDYKEFKFVGPPPLFIHQYSHVFVDFKGRRDNYMDYFENSVQATLANRQWCIDNMDRSKSYGPDSWGLTACDGPGGYKAYGAPNGENDGTVAPTAAIGSIIFTPELSMKLMKYLYTNHKDRIWGKYGFVDSFNWGRNWVSSRYIGIDEGPIVLMIENYRTGMVWKYFMQNENIKKALGLCGLKSTGKPAPKGNFTF